jgi:hypothetical protein
MRIGDIVLACFVATFGFATLLLLLPRFARYARWLPEGAPMSLRSRLLFPSFPILAALIVMDVLRPLCILPGLAAWLAGFISYLADRRRYRNERTYGT